MRSFESTGVESPKDYLMLSRHINIVRRCHTLPVKENISVGNHTLNCLYLYDWLIHNKYFAGPVYEINHHRVKTFLQYHDFAEIIIGDMPRGSSSKLLHDLEEEVHTGLTSMFIDKVNLGPSEFYMAKQVDYLELLLDLKSNGLTNNPTSFTDRRLANVYKKGLSGLIEFIDKAIDNKSPYLNKELLYGLLEGV